MSIFKEVLEKDKSNFVNISEFAEVHNLNGADVEVLVDNDRLMQRSKKEYDGITVGELLFFVDETKLVNIKSYHTDSIVRFDGIPYVVFDFRKDMGLCEIILRKNVS